MSYAAAAKDRVSEKRQLTSLYSLQSVGDNSARHLTEVLSRGSVLLSCNHCMHIRLECVRLASTASPAADISRYRSSVGAFARLLCAHACAILTDRLGYGLFLAFVGVRALNVARGSPG